MKTRQEISSMNRMRFFLYALAILPVLLWVGCIQDKCGSVRCKNEGVCVTGTCACKSGYEGEFCETGWHQKFSGRWKVEERDRGGNLLDTYSVYTSYYTVDTFLLNNFRDTANAIVCARTRYKTFAMQHRVLVGNDSLLGGEALLNDDATVSGIYSYRADSIDRTVLFTLKR